MMNPQTRAIAAALDFIEGHLCEPVTVGDIANAAGYSLFHFIRIFNKLVRHTPYDYLIRRRLSVGAEQLLRTDAQVLEIALACQFDSHEGFTRAFGKLFGMPPSTWRENGFQDLRRMMPALGEEDLLFRQLPGFSPPQLTRLEKSYLAGWMALHPSGSSEALLGQLEAALAEESLPERDRILWEIQTLPTPAVEQVTHFWGIRLKAIPETTRRLALWVIPKGEVVCFSHPRLAEFREAALRYLYHTFLPRAGLPLGEGLEMFEHANLPALYLPIGVE
jgi:AraC-like DNA-binding protein